MDIRAMTTLMEIKAMQSVGSLTSDSSNDTMFNELLGDILQSKQSSAMTQLTEALGTANKPSQATSTASQYLDAFLYKGTTRTVQTNTPLERYIRDYIGQQAFENVLAGANRYKETIAKAANTYNVPEKLIAAIMKQESNFNPNVVSTAGAVGLMQLMPGTAKYLKVQDARDEEQNIMGGTKYLRQMLDQFGQNTEIALAAYNAGPGNVKKYNGIPPFKETQNYVKKVLNYFHS